MHDVCRILLVDDHKLLMEGIRSLLAPHSHLRVAGMAPDGKEAVGLAATLSPDLVIMDISMPGMNGVEASRAILQIRPETRILIYTGHEDQRHLLELIQLGIMGHVCKSDPPSVLLQAIDAVWQGEVFLSCADRGGCMAALMRQNRQRLSPAEGGPDIGMLSPREKEIFRLLADGYSVRQIGDALNISPKTVETHKYSVLTKLRAGSINELTKMAIRLGLVSL